MNKLITFFVAFAFALLMATVWAACVDPAEWLGHFYHDGLTDGMWNAVMLTDAVLFCLCAMFGGAVACVLKRWL